MMSPVRFSTTIKWLSPLTLPILKFFIIWGAIKTLCNYGDLYLRQKGNQANYLAVYLESKPIKHEGT